MKPENQKTIDEFLSRADEMGDDIIAQTEEWLGVVPFIFTLMRERPEAFALSVLGDHHTARPTSLDPQDSGAWWLSPRYSLPAPTYFGVVYRNGL